MAGTIINVPGSLANSLTEREENSVLMPNAIPLNTNKDAISSSTINRRSSPVKGGFSACGLMGTAAAWTGNS